ncbi:MAG: hypothetical protein Q7S29_06365 [Candidatus Peribacter sp.]|nr:hypothetical protein [Candidatus Peribacter sp.]
MQQSQKIFWGLVAVALLYLLMGSPIGGDGTTVQATQPALAGQPALPTGSCHTGGATSFANDSGGGGGCGCGGGAQ